MISKDKEILAAEEKLKRKRRAYSDLEKRIKDNEALSTRAMKKLSEKQKIIQEQAKIIKEKEKTVQKFWQLQKTLMRRYRPELRTSSARSRKSFKSKLSK